MTTVPQQNQSSGVSILPLIVFGVLSLVFGFAMWLLLPAMQILPPAASVEAQRTDDLFRVLLGIGGVVFFLVQGLIYYAAVAFRAKANDASDGPNIHGNVVLEIVWTIVPSVIVVFLAIYSYTVWRDNTAIPESPNVMMTTDSQAENVVINAIGQRYAWSFEYITNDFADVINDDDSVTENAGERVIIRTSDLYIYAGQQVDINMNTLDVIHSFWAPEMRVKQDLLPGRTTNILFTPQLPAEEPTWEAVIVHNPVTLYTSADLNSEVMLEIAAPAEGELARPFEFALADVDSSDLVDGERRLMDENVGIFPESGTAWVRVLTERGEEAFMPIDTDTVIGRVNRYRLICTELCGGGHGDMFTDIVMFENAEQFETVWFAPTVDFLSVPAGDPFEVGINVINNYSCFSCHVLVDQGWTGVQGPALDGIGSRTTQRAEASGEAIGNEVDPGAEYIVQSIRLSQDYLVAGYGPIMPYFHPGTATGEMTRQDLMGIVAYLCTQTASGNPADSDCGFTNWEFDASGVFTGDVDGLVDELMAITEDYED
ncbi:MAG: hypothetical protein Phog2KO_29530 [Phototrophicaceae bacterium]